MTNQNKKYEFTGETLEYRGRTLHQIRALRDFERYGIEKGDIGGWIESEDNLSREGDCWILPEGKVYDNGKIYDGHLIDGSEQQNGEDWTSNISEEPADEIEESYQRGYREQTEQQLQLEKELREMTKDLKAKLEKENNNE